MQVEALVLEHGFDAFGYRYVGGGVVAFELRTHALRCVRCSPNLAIARHALPRSAACELVENVSKLRQYAAMRLLLASAPRRVDGTGFTSDPLAR